MTLHISDSAKHKVWAIPVLQDNIIWVWTLGKEAVVIDPGLCEPVEAWLKDRALKLNSVLQTHHHSDHIGGTQELLKHWPKAEVIASEKDIDRIPFQTISVRPGDEINLLNRKIQVIDVSGHTSAHLAYYLPKGASFEDSSYLFCGDALFAGGCGRIFEGSAQDMFSALNRISTLPKETEIFCAHEYTEANLTWAASIKPGDANIQERLKQVKERKKNGELTLPTNLAIEQSTNLFLRAKSIEEFASLRTNKDLWKNNY